MNSSSDTLLRYLSSRLRFSISAVVNGRCGLTLNIDAELFVAMWRRWHFWSEP